MFRFAMFPDLIKNTSRHFIEFIRPNIQTQTIAGKRFNHNARPADINICG